MPRANTIEQPSFSIRFLAATARSLKPGTVVDATSKVSLYPGQSASSARAAAPMSKRANMVSTTPILIFSTPRTTQLLFDVALSLETVRSCLARAESLDCFLQVDAEGDYRDRGELHAG